MAAAGGVAKRVDHVNIGVSDPRPLFSVLTERFGLPALWPPAALMPGGEIAGVGVGNVHVEPTRLRPGRSSGGAADARPVTVAFEPEGAEQAAAALAPLGIPHTPPIPYVGVFPAEAETELFHRTTPGAGRARLWTWVMVGGFLGDRRLARRYSSRLFRSPWLSRRMGALAGRRWGLPVLAAIFGARGPFPFFVEWEAFDIAAARARAREELERRDGGPLGIVGMKEIVVGASDPREEERWGKLLDPAPRTADGGWELGDGPAVRLVEGDDRIGPLVWEVASLERAERYLRDEGMLGPVTDREVSIDPASLFGLDIRLVQAD